MLTFIGLAVIGLGIKGVWGQGVWGQSKYSYGFLVNGLVYKQPANNRGQNSIAANISGNCVLTPVFPGFPVLLEIGGALVPLYQKVLNAFASALMRVRIELTEVIALVKLKA